MSSELLDFIFFVIGVIIGQGLGFWFIRYMDEKENK